MSAVERAAKAINGHSLSPGLRWCEECDTIDLPDNHQARAALSAALDVEESAEALARRAAPRYWSEEHRHMLLTIDPDEARVDKILDQAREGHISRFRTQVADLRDEILYGDVSAPDG